MAVKEINEGAHIELFISRIITPITACNYNTVCSNQKATIYVFIKCSGKTG